MSSVRKRKERLKSPEYRTLLGMDLRKCRHEKGYSLSDICDMTGMAKSTIIDIEKGITINIDYYVEFAKAVGYPLKNLRSFKIPLKPINELSSEKKARTFLTRKIREIINMGFLENGKTVDEIIDELVRLNCLEREKTSSKEVSGVMRNLIEDNTVEVKAKIKRKNIYVRFDG